MKITVAVKKKFVSRKQLLRRFPATATGFPLTRTRGLPIMARRRKVSDIGCMTGFVYEQVKIEIQNKLRQEMVVTNPLPFTDNELIVNAVPDEVRLVLSRAREYLEGYHYGKGTIPSLTGGVNFVVDFAKQDMLVPQTRFIRIQPPLLDRAQAWTSTALAIQGRWAAVRFAASWLHKNATLSAIRYYWPAMMSLLPADSTELAVLHRSDVGGKYKEPPHIGRVLHLLRATATTVAASQLLPDFAPMEDNKGIQVVLQAREIHYADHSLDRDLAADSITLDM